MSTYNYKCQSCGDDFTIVMRMSEYESTILFPCPSCASDKTRQVLSVPLISFTGDGWATKNNRVRGQMETRRSHLADKEREAKGDGMIPSLQPNVGGEQVSSWAEASKLAKDQGKNTSGYEQRAREETKPV